MTADTLLERLEGVRSSQSGQWVARCPAHEDRSPSLSIREADDGKVLITCFAGCSAYEIVSAVGLEMTDLFPPRVDIAHQAPARRRMSVMDAWHCAQLEATVVLIAAGDLAAGKTLSSDDMSRLREAFVRLKAIDEVVYGAG